MDRSNFLGRAVALVFFALVVIIGAWLITTDTPEQPDPHILSINTTNAAQMHEYGLPTKTDVIEWHVHGSWAYRANGRSFVYADLPGGCTGWDDLYKIQPNTVFVK